MTRTFPAVAVWLALICAPQFSAAQTIPALQAVPPNVHEADRANLEESYRAGMEAFRQLRQDALDQRQYCTEAPSTRLQECQAWLTRLGAMRSEYLALIAEYDRQIELSVAFEAEHRRDLRVIAAINSWVLAQGWSPEERARLAAAMGSLRLQIDKSQSENVATLIWEATYATRIPDAVLATAVGPDLLERGLQQQDDCTLYALATASGRDYEVVAGDARRLLESSTWRGERPSLQRAIDTGGLNGGELIILAEQTGRVEILPPTSFAATVAQGRPVMARVQVQGGDHQIVLSRTFQYENATYFEVIDSTRARRYYMTAAQLDSVLLENGIAYSPN